jgi:hypothetical protein
MIGFGIVAGKIVIAYFISGGQQRVFLAYLINGDIAHYLEQPGFAAGSELKLVELAVGPQIGLLNEIFSVPGSGSDGQCKPIQCVEMRNGNVTELFLHPAFRCCEVKSPVITQNDPLWVRSLTRTLY